METKPIYEVAEVDQPVKTERELLPATLIPPDFGAFYPQTFTGVTTPQTARRDIVTHYVTVFASVAARVQLGGSIDGTAAATGGSALIIPAGRAVCLPTQGHRQVTFDAAVAATVIVVWHDELIRIWE